MQAVTNEEKTRPLDLFRKVLELFDSGDIESALSHYDKEADVVFSGARGFEEFGELIRRICAAFPDGKHEVSDAAEMGNALGVELVFTGTHKGSLMASTRQEISPSGRTVRVPICEIIRLRDGRILSQHTRFDSLDPIPTTVGRQVDRPK
ncbi:MAG TPA: ester cyclase [Nitrososphaerales archaeon]|nr:ester cyclase [Nitrososphaerales archaeon]